jgi:hypothetical protein
MKKLLLLVATTSVLTACGGGGGGGGSPSPIYSTTTYNGTSVSVAYTGASIGNPTTISTGATYAETVDSNNIIKAGTFTAANGNSATFNVANGDTIVQPTPGINAFTNAAGTQMALTGWASYWGWSYQSFGVWTNGNTTGQVSAGSAGTATTGTSIPTSGTGTYTGKAAGLFGNASTTYFVTADMSATANFATRNIAFATTNSVYSPTLTGTYSSAGGLNLSSTMSYSANTNSFSGTVNSSGATVMTGSIGGQFYGPTAQEIGGVFAVKNGNIGYIGGFGGKR